MSTEKSNKQAKRFALLSRMEEKIFHASDLAILWEIPSKNTLYTTLKRYTKAGVIFRIFKGLYSLAPVDALDPYLLGAKALHEYCYYSTETILFKEGYLSRRPGSMTMISSVSKRFTAGGQSYHSRRLEPQFLTNSSGIHHVSGIIIATAERAIADILYFNPRFHFDKKVDWKKIKEMQKEIGYPLTEKRYDFAQA